MSEDETFEALSAVFKTTVHDWPHPLRQPPSFWRRGAKAHERKLNEGLAKVGRGPLTDDMRARFYEQVRVGQDIYEDAGGYAWRCWKAMLGMPFAPALLSYRTITVDDLRALSSPAHDA